MERKPKRKPYEIKKKILLLVKDHPRTYGELQRKVNTNDKTIRNYCNELSMFGFLKIEKQRKNPKTGKPCTIVKLTKEGQKLAIKLSKR